MRIAPFRVEQWMTEHETGAKFNIAETSIDPLSVDELLSVCGVDRDAFLSQVCKKPLTYGEITGGLALREETCLLYRSLRPSDIVTTHGGTGGNNLVIQSLVEPGDEVVCIAPCYQQLYSIPGSCGAKVRILWTRPEDGWIPDLDKLKALVSCNTKIICMSNPNNPTGAFMPSEMLGKICSIAERVGAWVLCDEVYGPLTPIADIYDRGISVCSMSKIFSLPGLRLGWIATKDREAMKKIQLHRDYDHISCGMLDEAVAHVALSHADKILDRNQRIVRDGFRILSEWVSSEPHLNWVAPKAGTTAFVTYNYSIPSEELCSRLYDETGVLVVPGACFGIDNGFRVGYACKQETLKIGLSECGSWLHEVCAS